MIQSLLIVSILSSTADHAFTLARLFSSNMRRYKVKNFVHWLFILHINVESCDLLTLGLLRDLVQLKQIFELLLFERVLDERLLAFVLVVVADVRNIENYEKCWISCNRLHHERMQVHFAFLKSFSRLVRIDYVKNYRCGNTLQVTRPKLPMVEITADIPQHETFILPNE